MAELSQLAFRLVSVAQRAVRLQLAGGALQLCGGTVTLVGLGEGAARERARQRCLDRRPGLVGGSGRRERPVGCSGGVPGVKVDGRRRSICPGRSHRELQRRRPSLRAGDCTFRLGIAVEREPAAREQLEAMGPRTTGDEH